MPETTVDSNTQAVDTTSKDPKPFKEAIPEAYRDKPYLKDIMVMNEGPEAMEAVFKKLDGAQTLIGKKTGIPGADASEEEVKNFYAGLRPEKVDDYEVKVAEGQTADEAHIKRIKEMFYKADLSLRQATALQIDIAAMRAEENKAIEAAQKKVDDEFDVLTKATFAEDNAKVLAWAKKAIDENVPENLKTHIPNLPNESLVVLAGVLDSFRKKYISEDDLGGGTGAAAGGTEADLRAEGRELQASKEYTDPTHPGHEKAKARVAQIYADVAEMQNRQKKK